MQDKHQYRVYRPQAMFNTIRRLHGQNLENQGLNNLTEAFQSFMTRARYFTLGIRRTWSHGAVEFMKYRRLLPMLVQDEHELGSAFDTFDIHDRPTISAQSNKNDERKITVSNVSNRVTLSQIQSFFSKFGIVQHCNFPNEDRRQSIAMYATLPKHSKKPLTVNITFKDENSAVRAKNATSQELKFYGQTMLVTNYVPSRRRTTSSNQTTNDVTGGIAFACGSRPDDGKLSRSSSLLSVSSSGTLCSQSFPLDDIPARALEIIFRHLNPLDRIRLERTNKSWLEAGAKAWSQCERLSFADDRYLNSFFTNSSPLRHAQFLSILMRCSVNLKVLDISSTTNLLDDKAIEQIGQICPSLESVDISGVRASPDALCLLSESLPHLKSLAYREMKNSSERCFWYLFKGVGGMLEHVDLRGCTHMTGRCLKLLGIHLKELLLDGCTRLTDESMEELCIRCKDLRVLKLNGCYTLTDQSLSLISRHLMSLETFTMAGDQFASISSTSLMSISRLSSLEHLELDYQTAVNSDVISAISDGLPALKSLSLAFCGSDTSVDSQSLKTLAKLTNLREIDLSGLVTLNSETLKTICSGCSQLERVILRSCIYLNDEGVKALDSLKKLELVDISGCILVSSVAVQHLIKAFSAEKDPEADAITLRIGGTVCEPHQVRCHATRICLDLEDYSTLSMSKKFIERFDVQGEECESDVSDDGFGMLSAHRSFVADALTTEDDAAEMENEKLAEWAAKEAKELGLLNK
ncbi:putative RNA-binding protein [Aphelenchoides besseyi]|nr:putative RNA-binding protein [Aphelenchoides besseyi]KAI6194062.1 putative RNA-binding protein [Aphelenchoides besseyi]